MKAVGLKTTVALIALLVLSCGKKGPPTLPVYEKPPVPVELVAVHREGVVYLTWLYPKDKIATVRDYRVMRSVDGASFRKVGVTAEKPYMDRTVEMGKSYAYHVVARNKDGILSERSPVVRIVPREVPSAPQRLEAEVLDESVRLRWVPSQEDVLYNVYMHFESGASTMEPVNPEPLSSPVYDADPFVKGPVYYTVRALRGGSSRDEGPVSGEVVVSPGDFVPAPPTTVRTTVTSGPRVLVAWTPSPAVWVKYYRVYRSVDDGQFAPIGRSGTPAFIDSDVPKGLLRYRISAVGPEVEGPPSKPAEINVE